MKRLMTTTRVFWVVSFLLSSVLAMALPPKEAAAAESVTLKVYDPTGAFEVTNTFAARLDNLSGKTICEVSDVMWEADRTFPLIAKLLQNMYPATKIITYDKFPILDTTKDVAGLEDAIKKAGCQAAIVGNAG